MPSGGHNVQYKVAIPGEFAGASLKRKQLINREALKRSIPGEFPGASLKPLPPRDRHRPANDQPALPMLFDVHTHLQYPIRFAVKHCRDGAPIYFEKGGSTHAAAQRKNKPSPNRARDGFFANRPNDVRAPSQIH